MTNCELCWQPIKGNVYEYDGNTMCEECYERTVPTLDDIKSQVLYENEEVWRGTYLLDNGNYLKCHECWQYCESDWDKEDKIVSSIYYDISLFEGKDDSNEFVDNIVDGGEYGFTDNATFSKFMEFVEMAHGCSIIQRISDDN